MAGICELCEREVSRRTKHHLVPRTRLRARRKSGRREAGPVAWLCVPCHKQVHSLLDEKRLEQEFDTIERLAAEATVAKFVAWIRNRPDGTNVISHPSRARGSSTSRNPRRG